MQMQVKKGDMICAYGISAVIDRIIYQDIHCPDDGRMRYADVEFIDSTGNYRHYKSSYDGGSIRLADGTAVRFQREIP